MMDPDYERCLRRKSIKSFSEGRRLVSKEIGSAESDLASARESFQRENYKWATIQAYYAMFHTARALLYSQSLREKSHYCLAVALRALFVDTNKIEKRLSDDFFTAMALRENADYESTFSDIGAQKLIDSAVKFIEKAKEILN